MFRKTTKLVYQLLGRVRIFSTAPLGIDNDHLRYDSVEDWMEGKNVPMKFINEPDPALRDQYIQQYGELRRHLYAKHVETLQPEEQRAIKDGCHPSQSHRFAESAQPYCERLKCHLVSKNIDVFEVHLGWYHGDRLVLSVETPEQIDSERLRQLPWLFEGFEIKYISIEPRG